MTVQQQEDSLRALARVQQKINDLVDGILILMQVNESSAEEALHLITLNDDISIDEEIKVRAIQEVKSRMFAKQNNKFCV